MNHQREFIHFMVSLGFDLIGIRWDGTHADNLIVFEKIWSIDVTQALNLWLLRGKQAPSLCYSLLRTIFAGG